MRAGHIGSSIAWLQPDNVQSIVDSVTHGWLASARDRGQNRLIGRASVVIVIGRGGLVRVPEVNRLVPRHSLAAPGALRPRKLAGVPVA